MSQQYQPQSGQQLSQQPQQAQMSQETSQGFQQSQGFRQSVSPDVSQAVQLIESFESEAEWAKTRALQGGDGYAAQELEDLVELVNLQKKLILRQSWHAPTVGQCTQEAIQHGSQELLQSYIPEVQEVAQQAQQLTQTIQQASTQAIQQSSQQIGGQSQMGGQTQFSGQSQMGSPQY